MGNYDRIKELCIILNQAREEYYQKDKEIMSNFEYDKLYDELEELEKETGIVLSNSPTQNVGYEVVSQLPKVNHEYKLLSLDKTKEISKLKSFLSDHVGILSWKLDGLTIVLTYRDGFLVSAATRGNGATGELVTNNAKVFRNIPISIPFKGELIVRGEAVIKYSDFKKINEELDIEEQYKNPRNLCSGTVRQLNNAVTAKRNVNYYAYQLVNDVDIDFEDSKLNKLTWLDSQGFEVVEHKEVTQDTIEESIIEYEEKIATNDFASDGLVLTYDSISYSNSLGTTSKFPKDSIAFKWSDELKETKLIRIQWNTSRTGLINPIAIFEPVELEGTTVSKASVHNVSILEDLQLGTGDTIKVYKANMIIPQVAENLTKSGIDELPKQCPVCGGDTAIQKLKDVKALYCTNANCSAKLLKAFSHFVGRNAANIEGLSEATLDKFIENGYIKRFGDIYRISEFKDKIQELEGFGEKSYNKLINAIEKSKDIELPNFIYALGIQNVGLSNARLLCKHFKNDLKRIMTAKPEELLEIEGYGEIIANAIYHYFNNQNNISIIEDLLGYIQFEDIEENENADIFMGMTFVITGSVNHFKNRNEIKKLIMSLGGKAAGSVSSKTNYLINNDVESNSSKNKKAKELNVPIISEQDFIDMLGKHGIKGV